MTDHPNTPSSALKPLRLDQLPAGCVVVCATLRLAQTVAQAHDRAADPGSSWRTLQSTTFPQWLQAHYDAMALRDQLPEHLHRVRVLDGFQERLLWEQVIHEHLDRQTAMLFDVGALAATAAEAHALIVNWGVRDDAGFGTAFGSEEQIQFRHWRTRFLAQCRERDFVDATRLNALLIEHLADCEIAVPTDLAFAGFDHFTPLEQRFQTILRERGCQLYRLDTGANSGAASASVTPQIHQAVDITQECLGIARWAADHLKRNPQCRIGIVAPDLASYQRPLVDALEDQIDPTLVLARHAEQRRPFNVSLGQPLAAIGLIRAALNILEVLVQNHAVEQARISELLWTPYWSANAEMDARARLDAALREGVAPKAPIKRHVGYAHYLFEKQSLSAPQTLGYLQALLATSQKLSNTTRLPSSWRHSIQALLGQCGWLAGRRLRSTEFQAREAFANELGRLAQLDQITGKVTFSRAVTLLAQLCRERLFQPKTRGTPAIQVLGVLEAAGLDFDAVWIAGLTDTIWPPAAKPNPLLGPEAQRAVGAPNSSATVQLDFAQRIQKRLLQSAPELHLSYPQQDQSTELQPSPLIRTLGVTTTLPIAQPPWAPDLSSSDMLEAIEDATAPPVPEGEKVSGGTGLLRAQAICPAWGFYQYRLGAKALATPTEGLDPRKRGTLVHDTLEHFWNETKTLRGLQALSHAERLNRISASAHAALEKFNADQKQEGLKPRQWALEHQRLVRLGDAWLSLENTRQEDFTVLEAEGKRDVVIEGIVAHMRIDRIDQLADARTVIIDYKTGASIDTKNWASDRITEPQLPIYAAIAEHPNGEIAGVAFGQVHLTGMAFKGIGQDDHLLPNVHAVNSTRGRRLFDAEHFPDWESVLAHWRQSIQRIAREVREGDAAIRITREADLQYCDVRPLLRMAERERQWEDAQHAEQDHGARA